MSEDAVSEKRKHINMEIRKTLNDAILQSGEFLQENFNELNISDYKYDIKKTVEELGLDNHLINQLVEDYVIQILKSKTLFIEYIEELKNSQELNYTPLKELSHKNLGVARNLRIEDGTKILYELMNKEDLDYLFLCVEALETCAIRLKPKCAYETLKLMSLKSSFYLTD